LINKDSHEIKQNQAIEEAFMLIAERNRILEKDKAQLLSLLKDYFNKYNDLKETYDQDKKDMSEKINQLSFVKNKQEKDLEQSSNLVRDSNMKIKTLLDEIAQSKKFIEEV
jgi:hypothetical protein